MTNPDLNLPYTLDVLLSEASVAKAARRLGFRKCGTLVSKVMQHTAGSGKECWKSVKP